MDGRMWNREAVVEASSCELSVFFFWRACTDLFLAPEQACVHGASPTEARLVEGGTECQLQHLLFLPSGRIQQPYKHPTVLNPST